VTVELGGRRFYAHRVLAQRWLGRPLKPNEIVHHIDRDGLNNSPSNLQVATRRMHAKAHADTPRGPVEIPGVPTLADACARYESAVRALLKQSA
jgi:hypothetical protein